MEAEVEAVSLPSTSRPVSVSGSVSDLLQLQLPVDDDDEGAMSRSAAVTEVDDSLLPQSS